MNIIPRGILAEYLFQKQEYGKEETIRRMTFVRPVKEWLMAGNPMSAELYERKCKKWSRRFPVEFNRREDELDVIMSRVIFHYSWKDKKGTIILDKEAAKRLGWKESVYTLNGKHCPNIDRVLCLNERLENAIELPSIISWLEDSGVMQRKEQQFTLLQEKLDCWSRILNMYCCTPICIYSSKKLKRRETDDIIRMTTSFEGERSELLTLTSGDFSILDNYLADKYLPWLYDKLATLEQHLACLNEDKVQESDYLLEPKTDIYLSNFEGRKAEPFRPLYNVMCQKAECLGMQNAYDSHYFYFCFIDYEGPLSLLLLLHIRSCNNDLRMLLRLNKDTWQEDFSPFWEEFKLKAKAMTDMGIKNYKHSIEMINMITHINVEHVP